jgi:hypothetical protein
LRASVYVLKYLGPDRRSRHKKISALGFHYAAKMDKHPFRSAMIPILDELLDPRGHDVSDPATTGLVIWIEGHSYRSNLSFLTIKTKISLWQISPRSLQYDLTTIPATFGCLYYIRSKISDGLSTEYPKRFPLLWSVIFNYVTGLESRRVTNDYCSLLEFLVDQGAKVGSTWLTSDELQLLLETAHSGKVWTSQRSQLATSRTYMTTGV